MNLIVLFTVIFTVLLLLSSRRAQPLLVRLLVGLLTFTFIILSAVWFIADALTGEGFNAAVIFHMRTGIDGAGLWEYLRIIVFGAGFIALAIACGIAVFRLTGRATREGSKTIGVLLLTGLVLLTFLHPTINAVLGLVNKAVYGEHSVVALAVKRYLNGDQGDAPFDDYYKHPALSVFQPPKLNLVFIYAESLELSYFDETRFPGLITELRRHESQAVNFTNILSTEGATFTIGGMVASQCGLPLITSGHPNSMRGMDRFLSGAECISDLLKDAGYTAHYMGGADHKFAGKGKFYETHSFDSIEGLEELRPTLEDPEYVHTWGLYDDSLLERFNERFERLSKADKPFGLFTLTLDTHHPHGHQSKSCEGREYGDGSNPMLNAVHCSDYLLAKTLDDIFSSPWTDNTLVVLASDHLAMPNDAYDLLTAGPRRNLLWMFPPNEEAEVIADLGTTLDTPSAIMGYLGAPSSPFGLGRDLTRGDNSLIMTFNKIDWQVREWRGDLAEFWQLPGVMVELAIDPETKKLSTGERAFQIPALLTLENGAIGSIKFEFDTFERLYDEVSDLTPDDMVIWVDACERLRSINLELPKEGLCVFAGKAGAEEVITAELAEKWTLESADLRGVAEALTNQITWRTRQRRIERFSQTGMPDITPETLKTPLLANGPDQLWVKSTSGSEHVSLIRFQAEFLQLKRGISLFEVSQPTMPVLAAHYDPCNEQASMPAPAVDVIRAIESAEKAGTFLLIAHDSATCGAPLAPIFNGLPLSEWQELGVRQPYVALFSLETGSPVIERLGEPLGSLDVTLLSPKPAEPRAAAAKSPAPSQ